MDTTAPSVMRTAWDYLMAFFCLAIVLPIGLVILAVDNDPRSTWYGPVDLDDE